MSKILKLLLYSIFHIASLAIILMAFMPMAKWYFENPTLPPSNITIESRPLWGVDFFYTVTLTNFLKENLTLPPGSWLYTWFAGWPFQSNFPILHFYLILPLLSTLQILSAVKIYMLIFLFLFFLGIYACCWKLSRNFILSVILAIASVYSVGVYGTLMWGGSLPSHATQAFYPWVVFFVISYLQTSKLKHLLTGSLLAGIAIWGHPQIVISYIYPTAALLFLFSSWGVKFINRIKSLFLFLLVSIIIGLPLLYPTFGPAAKGLIVTDSFKVASSTAKVDPQSEKDIIGFHRKQPERIYTDTNKTIFIFIGISAFFYFITLLLHRKLENLLYVFPFLVITGYFIFYVYLFSYGISIYHGGWYRLFWSTPFWLGLTITALWGSFQQSLGVLLKKYQIIATTLISLIIGLIALSLLPEFSKDIKDKIIPRSNPSSAYPDILNLREGVGFEQLKGVLVPKWLDANNTNYRFYTADQTVNIWWNSLFKMPLERGYLDTPDARTRGYTFWLDAALSEDIKGGQQLETTFNYPTEIAFNNTLFLLDWYGIRFFESGHAGPTAYAKVPDLLTQEKFIKNKETLEFNKEAYSTGVKNLNYFEMKGEFVSPILFSTDAPTLGIFASDSGYETVIRAIADANLGVKKLIPIRIGENVDGISSNELKTFDAIFIYDYKYKNQQSAFSKLSKYLQQGGKIFIDTGVDTPESESESLPEIFPIESAVRNPIADTWDFEIIEDKLTNGINFSEFSAPLFDNSKWKFSFPSNGEELREGSQVLVKNHGKTLLVRRKVGNGDLIWSGINLPYHVSRNHNSQEVEFYSRIIKELIGDSAFTIPESSVKFVNAQKRILEGLGTKGILFKEQYYPGWSATAKSGGKSTNVKIWSAGPAYPGFMYIRVPQDFKGKNISITFNYRGSITAWTLFSLSAIVCLFILEYVLIGGIVLGRGIKYFISYGRGKLGTWWKEENE